MAHDDTDLIIEARKGSAQAFEKLVHRYDKQVFAVAAQYVNSADEAKDIYQEVFLRVYRSLNNFRFNSGFNTWLFRITTNVCLTHRDQSRRHRHDSIHDAEDPDSHGSEAILHDKTPGGSPDVMADSAEIGRNIETALDSLSPRQKLVFTLRHYQGYRLREIAVMMKCTEGTVKRYLFTATQKMRDELSGYME
jgi:RNA polymerase sigma-70 factor, ECF subfamily